MYIKIAFAALKWITGGASPFKNYGLLALGGIAMLGGLWTWHKLDKRSEVRAAVVEYVAAQEIAAKEATIKELARRNVVAKAAAAGLEKELEAAEQRERDDALELLEYVANNPQTADTCTVNDDLLGRLRNK